jgi:hypothetical protein
MNSRLVYVRDLTWEEAFDFWRESEGENSKWAPHARERGFQSWEEWRRTMVAPARPAERRWRLYRVTEPLVAVPTFRGAPFRSWIQNVYGDLGSTPAFADIVRRPEILKHEGVRALAGDFPRRTTIIGIEHSGDVVIIEGMHRSAALALAAAEGKSVETELYLALGSELPGDLADLGGRRKDGTPA